MSWLRLHQQLLLNYDSVKPCCYLAHPPALTRQAETQAEGACHTSSLSLSESERAS